MMDDGMMGGPMAFGMGAWSLLVGLVVILAVVALVRFVSR